MTPNDTAKAVAEAPNESRADGGPGQPVDVAADRYILESELQNRQTARDALLMGRPTGW